MKLTESLALIALVCPLAYASARSPQVGTQQGTRSDAASPAKTQKADRTAQDSFASSEWRAALLEPDLNAREESFQRLISLAKRNSAARDALGKWAAETKGELAWTSRLALRELKQSRDLFESPWFPQNGHLPGHWSPFEDIDAFGMWDALRDLEDSLDLAMPPQGVPVDARSRAESFSLKAGPEGVKVEVREVIDGEEKVSTYEAENLEVLLEQHPELRDRMGYGDLMPQSTRDRLSSLMERMRRGIGMRFDLDGLRDGEVPTDRLGVLMRDADQYASSINGLEPGVGLLVERVFPHTLAYELGLRRGDVLVELNGTQLRTGADVQRALKDRAADEAIELKILDASGQNRSLTWKP